MKTETLRRADRAMTEDVARRTLESTEWGTLSFADDEGVLHTRPLSYAVKGDRLYFHGAKAGEKWTLLQTPREATFVAVTGVGLRPAEFTTSFDSTMVRGVVSLVTDEYERREGFNAILNKYCHTVEPQARTKYFEEGSSYAALWRLDIRSLTGKHHE